MASHLSIEEVARRTGLTAHTLRYYERIGLIAPVARGPGGQRRYAAADMAWIEFLLRLRTTHMPIGRMRAFATLRATGDATVPERRRMLEAHRADVLARIDAMRQAAEALTAKIDHYRRLERSAAPEPDSPIPNGANPHDAHDAHDADPGPLRTRPRQAARDRR